MKKFYVIRKFDNKYAHIRRNCFDGNVYIEYVNDKNNASIFEKTVFNLCVNSGKIDEKTISIIEI